MKVLVTLQPSYTHEVGNAITSQVLTFQTKNANDVRHHMQHMSECMREDGILVIWHILPEI